MAAAAPPVAAVAAAMAIMVTPGITSLPKLNPEPPVAASLAIRCWFCMLAVE